MSDPKAGRPTIAELEAMLKSGEVAVKLRPDGSVQTELHTEVQRERDTLRRRCEELEAARQTSNETSVAAMQARDAALLKIRGLEFSLAEAKEQSEYDKRHRQQLQAVIDKVRVDRDALEAVLRRLHDDCSYLKVEGKYLQRGPMMDASEGAVLAARALLSTPSPQGKGGHHAKAMALLSEASDVLDMHAPNDAALTPKGDSTDE